MQRFAGGLRAKCMAKYKKTENLQATHQLPFKQQQTRESLRGARDGNGFREIDSSRIMLDARSEKFS